ncbi:endonuclease/exonuclease/phosphatase family protein [Shewanella sp. UCD-KL12]|uniref:endonuclease/exonuclease/phosphatase family protein n=1 Tax=Shewanella sp. UCD-KL12 TaxID=1917163 RepID=UPI000970E31B|nr:endonuclease/exonuclease/phosphatase family protein [Shewanella sp. UCD-KL12]
MSSISTGRHDHLRLATFNLFNFIEPPNAYYEFENIYTKEQWLKKLDWISKYLYEHQPDVIGFQEVFSTDALKQLCQQCGLVHFAVLDTPDVADDFIYSKPVVALASRFPILDACSVAADRKMIAMMGLDEDFDFSRKPLRATIEVPKIGATDCYVVHFKSKRPLFEPNELSKQEADQLSVSPQKVRPHSYNASIGHQLAVEALGQWGSSIQRGSEAALLRYAMVERRILSQNPMILMGDFNDSLSDGVLAALTAVDTRVKPDYGLTAGSKGANELFGQYRLQDAYELYQSSQYALSAQARVATHYYFAKGSVLDYILLSNEFDPKSNQNLAEVGRYEVYDRHLINPSFEHDSQSTDHAPVMITLSMRE